MKNLQEMSLNEMREIDGGFIPLIIFGVVYSAEVVAAACGACFVAGLGIGALAASDDRK